LSTPRYERSSKAHHLFYQDIYDIENNLSVLVVIWSDMRLFHCPNVSLCRYFCRWTVSSREYRPLVDASVGGLLVPEYRPLVDTSVGGLLVPEYRPLVDTSVGGLLVPESIIRPVVIALVLTFIIEIYISQNNVIIYKT
jgi:hypothetical protein